MGIIEHMEPVTGGTSPAVVGWEERYDGIFWIALVDDEAIAGVSGPWPGGTYALTWWKDTGDGHAQGVEFHSSMSLARRRVESVAAKTHPNWH